MPTLLWRATVRVHRYLGITAGALMLMWFVSGAVMIYVPYPQISPADQLKSLSPISFPDCCAAGRLKIGDGEPIISAQIEMVAAAPLMRIRPDGRPPFFTTLDGSPFAVDGAKARVIARDAAARLTGGDREITSADLVDRDQWTVGEDYDSDRPLHRFAYSDPAGTQVYVSSSSGAIVLWTTANERFWNWLGAVPHWLYFTRLRSDGPLWSKVVIWSSILGGFLTLVGLCLGIAQFRRGPRLSPYRGWLYWHHLAGLAFGILTLTWVVSGTISMNPWGFLEGRGGGERQLLAGEPLRWSAIRSSLAGLDKSELDGAVNLTTAPYQGKLFWLVRRADGRTIRLNANGARAPFEYSDLWREGELLAQSRPIASRELITTEDAYYYSSPGNRRELPVYRVVLSDTGRTRYYIDPRTGALLGRIDPDRRGYRWLFDGLHRLDFFAVLRARPVWDVIILSLLLGGACLAATGTWLALLRLQHDTAALARRLTCGNAKRAPSTRLHR